ncbi:nucleotidyltransferase substrate binding protein [Microaerobacter geothermalis]|uniref:nucleotidyltransferase substrate binding protein n=1 Tax=Microaerobacter geothermalis TaxID=674972 RepID=UPI001F275368|nr:nucleotidyltransferase substrate binding protein [Microaerobacter geothermalis]MCF6093276.1 nucleotidyltransferase substrate binding protein [Microaerobacter geothermalis]
MDIEKLEEKFLNYSKALSRLKESLERDESDDIVLDAVIQRFEFTYELSWKLLKAYLSFNGIAEVRTLREAFKEAFAAGLLNEGNVWIDMLEDRNRTSHTYDEAEARAIYEKVKSEYYTILHHLKESIGRELE